MGVKEALAVVDGPLLAPKEVLGILGSGPVVSPGEVAAAACCWTQTNRTMTGVCRARAGELGAKINHRPPRGRLEDEEGK